MCKTVTEKVCTTVTETECVVENGQEKCWDEPREKCWDEPRQKCHTVKVPYWDYEDKKECDTVLKPVCRPVLVSKCNDDAGGCNFCGPSNQVLQQAQGSVQEGAQATL